MRINNWRVCIRNRRKWKELVEKERKSSNFLKLVAPHEEDEVSDTLFCGLVYRAFKNPRRKVPQRTVEVAQRCYCLHYFNFLFFHVYVATKCDNVRTMFIKVLQEMRVP